MVKIIVKVSQQAKAEQAGHCCCGLHQLLHAATSTLASSPLSMWASAAFSAQESKIL
jgi:hypothetical protein